MRVWQHRTLVLWNLPHTNPRLAANVTLTYCLALVVVGLALAIGASPPWGGIIVTGVGLGATALAVQAARATHWFTAWEYVLEEGAQAPRIQGHRAIRSIGPLGLTTLWLGFVAALAFTVFFFAVLQFVLRMTRD